MTGVRSVRLLGRLLRFLAPRGGVRAPLQRLLPRTGFRQIVVRREAVTSVLALRDLRVPYGDASRALGLGSFPLSLDPVGDRSPAPGEPTHAAARALVGRVIEASTAQHLLGVMAADELATELVERSRSRIDVNGSIVQPALHRWIEVWFGLPGEGQRLADVAALATRAIFFNPAAPTTDPDPTVLAEAVTAADALVEHLRGPLQTPVEGSLVAALCTELDGDLDEVSRFVIGLSVGPLTLGTWALTNVIAELLGTPPGVDDLGTPPDLDDLITRPEAADAYRRVLRAAPPLPGVPRFNPQERTIVSDLGSFTLPEGFVLAATQAADIADPVDAEPDVDLPFSAGPHRCMGPDHITSVSAVILHRLAARRPRLVNPDRPIEPGVPPIGHGPWPFPGRLQLDLAPKP